MRKGIFRLLAAIFISVSFTFLPGCGKNDEIEIKLAPQKEKTGMLFISGNVIMPGYYPLEDSDNFKTLIHAVGGTSPGADLEHMRLYVPAAGETAQPQKIDINRAEAWLLAALPGIGEVTAKRIVEYREKSGLFRDVNDLARVEGIGQATLDKIKNLVTIAE